MEKTPEQTSEQEKKAASAAKIYMFLTPIFALLALFNLYNWTQGSDSLPSVLSMAGMTFIGSSVIVGSHNKPLYYIFFAVGAVAVFGALIKLIAKLSN